MTVAAELVSARQGDSARCDPPRGSARAERGAGLASELASATLGGVISVGRRACLGLVAAVVALVAVVVLASPAAAHAELESTEPPSGAVVGAAPDAITLRFSEPVEGALGAVRVLDADGASIDVGVPERVAGDARSVRAGLPTIGQGTFVVAWRVTSADGHPINGAFTFQVGEGSGTDTRGLVEDLLAGDTTDPTVDTGLTVARGATYAGLAVLLGGLVAIGAVWPAGAGRRSARRLLWGGWALALVATLAAFALQGPYAAGSGVGDALDRDLWSSVADTRVGRATLARALLLLAAAALVATIDRHCERWWRGSGAVLGGVTAVAVALAGHATTERWAALGVAADTVHVVAMAVWLGGLAMLGILAVPPGPSPGAPLGVPSGPVARSVGAASATDLAAPASASADAELPGDIRLDRFSRIAIVAVTVLVVTGIVQSWRLVGSLEELVSTTYGRTLLVKIGLVVVMVGVALASRRALARRDGRSLRLFMRDEVAFGVGVLAVTAVLSGTPPAEVGSGDPVSVSIVEQSVIADITVDPATAGRPNEMHVYLTPPGGSLQPVADVEIRFTLPERDLGTLPVRAERAGPNHWVASGFVLPYQGDWRLDIVASVAEFEQVRLSTTIAVA